jgi:hypothetical protein
VGLDVESLVDEYIINVVVGGYIIDIDGVLHVIASTMGAGLVLSLYADVTIAVKLREVSCCVVEGWSDVSSFPSSSL